VTLSFYCSIDEKLWEGNNMYAALLLPAIKIVTFLCLQVLEGAAWTFAFLAKGVLEVLNLFSLLYSHRSQVIDKFNETSISA
jgi:hypothetical protein